MGGGFHNSKFCAVFLRFLEKGIEDFRGGRCIIGGVSVNTVRIFHRSDKSCGNSRRAEKLCQKPRNGGFSVCSRYGNEMQFFFGMPCISLPCESLLLPYIFYTENGDGEQGCVLFFFNNDGGSAFFYGFLYIGCAIFRKENVIFL